MNLIYKNRNSKNQIKKKFTQSCVVSLIIKKNWLIKKLKKELNYWKYHLKGTIK